MNVIDRLAQAVSPSWAERRTRARLRSAFLQRAYDAGRIGQATYGWNAPASSANSETYGSLVALRSRARDLRRNNPHAAKMIATLVTHSVGWGITATPKTGSDALDKQTSALWADWCAQCDADGINDFSGIQSLAATAMFEGGESLIRRRPRQTADRLPVPLQLQVMEPDYIDDSRDGLAQDGSKAIQGIQIDRIGRRTAYWMFSEHPGDMNRARTGGAIESKPVPADDIIHLYEVQRPGQMRGVPWLAPVMLRMRQLDDYEDAELVRKTSEACLVAMVMGDDPEKDALGTLIRDAAGNPIERLQAGMIGYSLGGRDVKFTQPSAVDNYGEYKRAQLMSIASGGRVTYELLSGDLSGVNYSSWKGGANAFRRMIETLQWTILVPRLCQPVWNWFIDAAIAAGRLPAGQYPVTWTEPVMDSVEPDKDAQADERELQNGLADLRDKLAARGFDPEAKLRQIAETRDLMASLGLDDLIPRPKQPNPAQAAPPAQG